ncbi:hypothetical protein [Brevibacterium aurantiacum]|uniref:Ketopantoate reductase N-terminal domain-containing protein n=2 Tax=Brevibacterium aurantiacum TaxID=273384 RepID=A0A2A3Z834_BREAU|nr:hypothetical protein [Brevibacterium aurantiacum]AZL06908.1 hypothetical protein CXR24_15985 [Brevibacterium aurantiacum]AZT94673.1 hypothetical protein CXR23_17230 [Brevibacterium aurantiacum]PCC47679.1 hypothetical protein CIK64_04100 [Brevibacterium aurantiacum]
MKVVFQGAGAIGAAAAALFGRRHETVVVSRSANPGSEALNSPDTVRLQDTVRPQSSAPTRDTVRLREAAYPRRVGSDGRETVRRVSVVDWATVSSSSWDLVVLTTRPGDLDEPVAASISGIRPSIIAITSQVDGDRDIAVSMFPDSEILVFSPALLSERTTGRNVRYWQPPAMPVFMASGCRDAVRRLRRELGGGLIVAVPAALLSAPPAVFIPYVAELSVREGSWTALRTHLRRPTQASAEAVHAVTGVRIPMSARGAGLVLDALELFVPIDVGEYAGRHFARHEGQTLDMLNGWAGQMARRAARRDSQRNPKRNAAPALAELAPALGELAQALRLRVTR